MISGEKIICITPALCELENEYLLYLAVETQCFSPPFSRWAGDHTGPGSQIWAPLSVVRAGVKALGEQLWKPARGFVHPLAPPQVSSHSFSVQAEWLISIVHQGFGNQVRLLWKKASITLDLENQIAENVFTKLQIRDIWSLERESSEDKTKIIFWTGDRHFEYLVLPFGPSKSAVTLQNFILCFLEMYKFPL